MTDNAAERPLTGLRVAYLLEAPEAVGPNVRQQMAALRRLGATVTACFLTGNPDTFSVEDEADKLSGLGHTPGAISGSRIKAAKSLRQWLNQHPIDLVICDQYKAITTGVLATLLPMKNRPRIIALLRGFYAVSSRGRRRFYRLLRHRISSILTISKAHQAEIRHSMPWYPSSQIFSLTNYLDTQALAHRLIERKQAREALGLDPDLFTFGTVCRFDPYKRVIDLVRATVHLRRRVRTPFQVAIIGSGKAEEGIRNEVRLLQLEDVICLTGRVEQASRYMRAFDAFVFPSVGDSFGRVLLEARAATLPIIAANSAGPPEVVGPYGLLAEPVSPKHLASKMEQLLTMPASARIQLGTKGLEWSDKVFTSTSLEKDLLAAIKQVISSN